MTTTPEEREAESRKYIAPLALALSSGRFAVYDPSRRLVDIVEGPDLAAAIAAINPDKWAAPRRPTFSLEDIGL